MLRHAQCDIQGEAEEGGSEHICLLLEQAIFLFGFVWVFLSYWHKLLEPETSVNT